MKTKLSSGIGIYKVDVTHGISLYKAHKLIKVTKTFLPPLEEYYQYLEQIWERGHITNHGPCVLELEKKIKDYLGVKHFFLVNNGTIAIQIAIKALDLKGEIITTPFSYVATTSSIVWENCTPVFADIDSETLCIDPREVENHISEKTTAILATHVYGNPCAVQRLEEIAVKHGLRIIYDAAHAFGVQLNGKSLMTWGDISTLSFHATKVFHTVEGGGIITADDQLAHRIEYMRNFGHNGPEQFWGVGINGKVSELHAAMGLVNLKFLNAIVEARKKISLQYDTLLKGSGLVRPAFPESMHYNYAYYPVIFSREEQLKEAVQRLNSNDIYPRRYFYPSLNELPYVSHDPMPISESISRRVLCLPLYPDLYPQEIDQICSLLMGKNGEYLSFRT